ncbi:vacuolar protein sorting-associated protein 13C-like [Oryzias melastigma]|uniref:vacuolar protein sorting-associated protein 13C-like n=1 Tax=Oryzias melastigma TaxID=30732 RepID=UPI00168D213D|nr:vacuolar protein sorting-associated protein 13C-like [Oryzias melastigma]
MLNLGCIQVVYLHKFFMSLLNFTNNFQAAKDTLSNATAQAAEKAASSVRDFAQKSFRLSMDIRLKAPLIIIPQSSTSHNALVIDLGLITVTNSYRLLSIEGCPLPAVIDIMDVQLGDLKLSRSCVESDSSAAIELLEPVNLHLDIQRNLSAFWYKKMAAVEIHGNLKPSKMDLSQDDLTMLLRIVTENLGEVAASLPSGSRQDNSQLLQVPKSSLTGMAG